MNPADLAQVAAVLHSWPRWAYYALGASHGVIVCVYAPGVIAKLWAWWRASRLEEMGPDV